MHYQLVCFCCLLSSNGLVAETYSSTWWAAGFNPYGISYQYDKYEAEETEESCCPMKKLDNTIYQMARFNLTDTKQHDCKDGCIYHDPQGLETCFTQGKQDAFCFQEIIRAAETEKECSGTRRLDGKTELAIDNDHKPWGPGAEVPYSLESPRLLETDKQLFQEAMAYVESLSCIRFIPWNGETHYLEFDRACLPSSPSDNNATLLPGCHDCLCFSGSYVDSVRGMSRGRVRLVTGTLLKPGNWEDRGHITHELLHSLGHHHTQNRPDRNEHISVHFDNILDPTQYERCTDCKVFNTTYDCMSIMHYRWNSLAVNRSEPTMSPLPGQNCDLHSRNRYLTWADIDMLNQNYNCPVEYSGTAGTIQSHEEYPLIPYNSSYRRQWHLTVEEGYQLRIEWLDFELEDAWSQKCKFDYVTLFDANGQPLDGNTGWTSCGNAFPPNVVSLSNRLTVEIKTDGSENFRGFKLRWTRIERNGNDESSSSMPTSSTASPIMAGEIASPLYPSSYPNNKVDTWTVEVPEGRRVKLEWDGMDIEETPGCWYDFIEMIEPTMQGMGSDGEVLMEKTCGRLVPPTLVSQTNQVVVTFLSDVSIRRPGFLLNWKETDEPPTRHLLLSPNYPRHYPDSLDTTLPITVGPQSRIALTFRDLAVEEEKGCPYDWVAIKDVGSGRFLVNRTCGYRSPPPTLSDTNRVVVLCHTDFIVSARGFKIEWQEIE